ncbi:unnamed protein product [Angiostrongylus costaricensis]|uniref:Uncharacterized protein n=1 Tax=Angiostrongylus costaricensis TaxID=334426 RepID=A0A0R3PA20_ANGCS|nr:unnamed protein product [Angiostrongylus costaricensis]
MSCRSRRVRGGEVGVVCAQYGGGVSAVRPARVYIVAVEEVVMMEEFVVMGKDVVVEAVFVLGKDGVVQEVLAVEEVLAVQGGCGGGGSLVVEEVVALEEPVMMGGDGSVDSPTLMHVQSDSDQN